MMRFLILSILGFLPTIALAQQNLLSVIEAVGGLIDPTVAVLVALALLGFLWGLAKFIFRVGGDEKAVEEGKRLMKWGLIALFVITSVWGIVGFLEDAFLPGYEDTGPASGGFGNSPPGGELPFTPFLPPVEGGFE